MLTWLSLVMPSLPMVVVAPRRSTKLERFLYGGMINKKTIAERQHDHHELFVAAVERLKKISLECCELALQYNELWGPEKTKMHLRFT
ncbi:uncharacterized protein IUM83_14167 [Phytophthora cinnamomi]|uniref:uncharacterized protein n=1 Tax=Phytophthora cinnamomi TaxID=4785 RepID=UPI0035598890|nr:hypothetical protein IUM83_14167 [Phytophthora cinnamomi]